MKYLTSFFRYANLPMVKLIIEFGAHVDRRKCKSRIHHHIACWNGRNQIYGLLLDHGANVNALDLHGCTPLHLTCSFLQRNKDSRLECIKLLLKYGADVNIRNEVGETALERASNWMTDIIPDYSKTR